MLLAVTAVEILTIVSIGVGCVTILGALVVTLRTISNERDEVREERRWVRNQLQANGRARLAGTQDETVRDLLEDVVAKMKDHDSYLTTDRRRLDDHGGAISDLHRRLRKLEEEGGQ